MLWIKCAGEFTDIAAFGFNQTLKHGLSVESGKLLQLMDLAVTMVLPLMVYQFGALLLTLSCR